MCGICGWVNSSSAASGGRDLLERMNATLAHRGPDDLGAVLFENTSLAMSRLSIIDLFTGHQPIANEDETCWIVCNGEIYNFTELRKGLEGRKHRFCTSSDTEVILHAFEEWGTDCLQHLRGMFAFAIYNKERRELFLARDPYGIKPLFYTELPQGFAFASELRALLKLPYFPRQIDWKAFHLYVRLNYIPAPWTMVSESGF